MKKLEEIQRGKLMSAYGGVGSIVETLDNGSLKILPFEDWPVYTNNITINGGSPNTFGASLLIQEPRLRKRLNDIGFTKLKDLFILPEVDISREKYAPTKATLRQTIASEYFPRWFYCPHCRKFQPIEEWEHEWKAKPSYKFRENPPACYDCSTALQSKLKRRTAFVYLEQTRFILASLDGGEIIDVPWGNLFNLPQGVKAWDYPTTLATKGLTFNTSVFTDNLYGLSVKRTSDNSTVRLSEIDNKYFIKDHHAYQMVPRNANNVYFPYVVSSIFIPLPKLSNNIISQIRQLSVAGQTANSIFTIVNILHPGLLTEEKIKTLINNNFDPSSIEGRYNSEDDFRDEEFDFITNSSNYTSNNTCVAQDFTSIKMAGIPFPSKIKGIYCLKKLKETKVQVAYSRIDNVPSGELDKDYGTSENPKVWYNVKTNLENPDVDVKIHPTSSQKRDNVRYMPAVEYSGEGFFVELDLTSVPNENIENHNQNKREVFLHTYCHLIMKELEFQCGYPLASLSERLYYLPTKGTGKFGFMIYTIGGEEGSYGGITSLFSNGAGKILQIIQSAIIRANDCPNDPICEHEGGHCFACLDVPETTCELFNKKLSRVIFNKHI